MKKRLLCVFLAFTLCLGLAACSSNTPSESKAPASDAPSQPSTSGSETSGGDSSASTWPSGDVSFYVPASPGGGTDMIARIFAKAMNEVAGANFVVINDNSGGGTVVCERIRNAKADGQELMLTNSGLCRSVADGTYDHSFDDFTILGAITTQGRETGGIWVKADSQFQTLSDLVAYAKENTLLSGVNGASGMATEALFEDQVDIRTTMVDAGPDADRITALIGGNIDICFLNTVSAKAYAESGDLRCLVILGTQRSEFLPDVPTMEEEGYEAVYPDMTALLAGPLGMSADDVAKISDYLKQANENAELQENYGKMGVEWVYKTPEETREMMDRAQEDADLAYQLLVEMGLA